MVNEAIMFQHTAARRRLERQPNALMGRKSFNTQPPEGGWLDVNDRLGIEVRFNTQPPEGGWTGRPFSRVICQEFQHTAARRRLVQVSDFSPRLANVSTHSRPKAAGSMCRIRG